MAFEDGDDKAIGILADRSLVAKADDYGPYAELALAEGADPQRLLERLMQSGARLRRFEHIEPSLHRIFLDKAGAEQTEPAQEVVRGRP